MAIFAVELAFKAERNDIRLGVRPKHREYLASLRERGKLLTAGPWADDTGALLFYDVADEAELRQILADDPYTPEDVCDIAGLHEWTLLFPVRPADG